MKHHKTEKQNNPAKESNKITRKEALKKAGKYAAVTAATMFVVLSPKESQAQSSAPPTPGW
ncbi:MAG: hypothetical protein JW842_00890 [Prolixibacteraceae bacterium]|nr:hypothetical protein [Prolixibacteraceae bacterium]